MFFLLVDCMLLFSIFVILLFSLYESKYNERDFGSINSLKFYLYFTVSCLLLVLYGILKLRFGMSISFLNGVFFFNSFYIVNDLIIFGKCFVLIVTIVCLLLSYNYFKIKMFFFIEYIIFILLAVISIFFFLSANDFFVVYLSIEMQAFCFYIIFSLVKYNNISLEASLKYFVLSVFASVILLLGISFIYGFCGTLKFFEISLLFEESLNGLNLYMLGLFFFFLGILFKLALVPFHYWIGDIYEGLPIVTLVWYVSVAKIPFVIFLINFVNIMHLPIIFLNFLFYIAILSIIFGAIAGLYQTNLMRMLAFASINHAGFILLSLSLGTLKGFSSCLVYLFVYVILNLGIFSLILLFMIYGYKMESWNIINIVEAIKMSKYNYIFSVVFSTFLLSFAGIPPFSGFFAKLGVFFALIESGNYFFFIIVVFFSIVSAVYYIRLVRFLFFSKDFNNFSNFSITIFSQFAYWVVVFCFLLNLFFFFFNFSVVYWFSYMLLIS